MTNTDSIIVDTSYLYALITESDPNYFLAQRLLDRYENHKLITTCFVFAELYWLLRKSHFYLISKIYEAVEQGIFIIVPFETSQLSNLKLHTNKYQDRLIDIADASLIALADKIGHGNILTKDKDFIIYRWNKKNKFTNLFSEF